MALGQFWLLFATLWECLCRADLNSDTIWSWLPNCKFINGLVTKLLCVYDLQDEQAELGSCLPSDRFRLFDWEIVLKWVAAIISIQYLHEQQRRICKKFAWSCGLFEVCLKSALCSESWQQVGDAYVWLCGYLLHGGINPVERRSHLIIWLVRCWPS